MTNIKNIKIDKGLWSSFLTILPYSIIPLIFLINFGIGDSYSGAFVQGITLTVGKDILSLFAFGIFVFLKKELRECLVIMKSKVGFFVFLSAIFGSSLGYTFFNTAFYLAGPSYSHIFTSLEPLMLVLLSYSILKRKFHIKAILGIVLTVTSTIALVTGEFFAANDSTKIIVGSILGILGALCWSIESIIFDKAITIQGEDSLMKLLFLKMFFALFFSLTIMFPISGAIYKNVFTPYNLFSQFFTNNNYLWRFLITGILIVAGRFLFFYGLKNNGSTIAQIFYNLTIILIPLLNLVWYGISDHYIGSNSQLSFKFQLTYWLIVPFMLLGTIITTIYRPKVNRKQ